MSERDPSDHSLNSPTPPEGMLRAHDRVLNFCQRLIDWGIVGGTLFAVSLIYAVEWNRDYTLALIVALLVFNLVAESNGLYRSWRGHPLRHEVLQVAVIWGVVAPALLFAAFATKTSQTYSRVVIVGWFSATPCLLVLWRGLLRGVLKEVRRRGGNSRSAGVVGLTPAGLRLARALASDPSQGVKVKAFYDDRAARRAEDETLPPEYEETAGDFEQLVQDARAGKLDIVYIALPLRAEERISTVVRALADTTATVYMTADLFIFDLMHGRWGEAGGMPVVSIFESPFQGLSGWVKRLEDIALSVVILSVIAIPMVFIAIAIKVTSRGPVFFAQRRYGLGGRPISVLKFRTMRVAEDGAVVKQAQRNDPRITPLGGFLRRTSLDELPQFLNVLGGSMSVVGPRPHAVAHNEQFRSQIHGYMLRHKVKPGITGWAQVNGWRGETDTVEKMQRRIEHDLYYINNWSFFWDMKIIFLTMFGSRVRENAY